jgi:hypothetical protein
VRCSPKGTLDPDLATARLYCSLVTEERARLTASRLRALDGPAGLDEKPLSVGEEAALSHDVFMKGA